MFGYVVFLDGVYDVLCALCMLNVLWLPVISPRLASVFCRPVDPMTMRCLAYWTLTNGLVRCSVRRDNLVGYTYAIEAMSCIVEGYAGNISMGQAAFVMCVSCVLCYGSWSKSR